MARTCLAPVDRSVSPPSKVTRREASVVATAVPMTTGAAITASVSMPIAVSGASPGSLIPVLVMLPPSFIPLTKAKPAARTSRATSSTGHQLPAWCQGCCRGPYVPPARRPVGVPATARAARSCCLRTPASGCEPVRKGT